ncbi:MAG: type II secretion system F family protein [Endomicrobium sp.]|jgi:type IV pilus assembly protein PilC|nr:type II secretion system F family protein [Endomicrobium sp.]
MPQFKYQAIDSRGQKIRGVREFPTKKDVILFLRGERLTPVSIEESGGARAVITRSFSNVAKPKYKSAAKIPGKVKIEDIALFCRQLATLVGAGVNLLEAVDDISDMSNNPKMRGTLKEVAGDLRSGTPLSDSLKKHKMFTKTLTSMVEVGERSGKLSKVLGDLALYLENNVKLIRKIKSASTYPMFIGCFFVLVLLALIVGIIPRFEEMFMSFGADLPAPTKVVMNISNFVIGNGLWLFLGTVFFIIGFMLFKKNPRGNLIYCRLLFKMPIFGKIYMKMVLARFFQTLSTLVKSGVDIVASLDISTNVMDNSFTESIMRKVKAKVLEGNQLGMEMEQYEMFPRMVTRMTIVGEKSGQLDAMFDKITDYFTDEVDAAVATISSVIEPVLIIGLGFIVGLAVTAMYLPIFYLASAMMG